VGGWVGWLVGWLVCLLVGFVSAVWLLRAGLEVVSWTLNPPNLDPSTEESLPAPAMILLPNTPPHTRATPLLSPFSPTPHAPHPPPRALIILPSFSLSQPLASNLPLPPPPCPPSNLRCPWALRCYRSHPLSVLTPPGRCGVVYLMLGGRGTILCIQCCCCYPRCCFRTTSNTHHTTTIQDELSWHYRPVADLSYCCNDEPNSPHRFFSLLHAVLG